MKDKFRKCGIVEAIEEIININECAFYFGSGIAEGNVLYTDDENCINMYNNKLKNKFSW